MQPRALVVDDCLTVRMDLRSTLANAGFLVVGCGTKAGAAATLKTGVFHLVILDVLLPDGSGIEILRDIKHEHQLRHIRTILLSTEAEVRSRIQGLSLGADRYVGKPYDRDYLARVARELCEMPMYAGPPGSRRALSGKKLLLVDDDVNLNSAIAEGLRSDGNEVVPAHTGEEALKLLAIEPFACVILNLTLPGIDGLETVLRLRRLPNGRDTRVLVVTENDEHWLRQQALAAGADEVALRTTIVELMRMRVSLLLMRRRSSEELAVVAARAGGRRA